MTESTSANSQPWLQAWVNRTKKRLLLIAFVFCFLEGDWNEQFRFIDKDSASARIKIQHKQESKICEGFFLALGIIHLSYQCLFSFKLLIQMWKEDQHPSRLPQIAYMSLRYIWGCGSLPRKKLKLGHSVQDVSRLSKIPPGFTGGELKSKCTHLKIVANTVSNLHGVNITKRNGRYFMNLTEPVL